MIFLKVTETRLEQPYLVTEIAGRNKREVISKLIHDHQWLDDPRFDSMALDILLTMHDDLRIGGPTWDVRFEFTFRE